VAQERRVAAPQRPEGRADRGERREPGLLRSVVACLLLVPLLALAGVLVVSGLVPASLLGLALLLPALLPALLVILAVLATLDDTPPDPVAPCDPSQPCCCGRH
jgi:hypothetical protein